MVLEDGYKTAPATVEIESSSGKATWLRIVMNEGRKRQIRETGKRIGLPVLRIIRVRIGPIRLGSLRTREWRNLNSQEIASRHVTKTPRQAELRGVHRSPEKK